MGEQDGTRTCPGCGAAGVLPGQLVCRVCYVPFALVPPPMEAAHASMAADRDPGRDPAPMASDRAAEADTRVIDRPSLTLDAPGKVAPPHALALRFSGGQTIALARGEQVRLGREPRLCPRVGFLTGHSDLSRLHATVAVDAEGTATVTDEDSTNGTFVDGHRLAPRDTTVLRPGSTLRLAADVTVLVLP